MTVESEIPDAVRRLQRATLTGFAEAAGAL